jgi:hypothetical protein
MRQLFDPLDARVTDAPTHVRQDALRHRRQILKITWDAADGYPEHAWGYIQWSVRPFTVGMRCNGTTDDNVHYIAMRLCRRLGLDYPALYARAYAWQRDCANADWLRRVTAEEWGRIARETVMPHLAPNALRALLFSLYEINNRSVVEVLESEFTRLGFDVAGWWNDRFAMRGTRGFKIVRGEP